MQAHGNRGGHEWIWTKVWTKGGISLLIARVAQVAHAAYYIQMGWATKAIQAADKETQTKYGQRYQFRFKTLPTATTL